FLLPYFLIILKPPDASPGVTLIAYSALFFSTATSVYAGIGSKAGVANLVLAVVIYRHYFVRRIRLSRAAIGAIACLMIVSYMGYLRAAGGADIIEKGLSGSIKYAEHLSAERVNPLSTENTEFFWSAGISSPLTPFEAFMVVLHTFPERLPFQNGRRLLESMVYPVFPRALFPSKPQVYGAGFFWDDLLGHLSQVRESGAISKTFEAISLPGHFYLDFGLPGLLVSGLLLGVIHRYIYRRLVLNGVTRGSICLYGLLSSYALIAARGFMWDTYFLIALVLFPIIFIQLLLTKRDDTAS
ncbi:MAG: hypothetical protein QF593_08385, partial [Nitrospinota bacterium]|nr:hypothetical protein [Nitrospinota bacterium]